MNTMTPPKKPRGQSQPPDPPPSKTTRNVGIPNALHDELAQAADEDDRSMNWMARRAIREYLDRRRRAKEGSG